MQLHEKISAVCFFVNSSNSNQKVSVMKSTNKWKYLSMSLAAGFIAASSATAFAEPFKVAFVYLGPVKDGGWTQMHDTARQKLERQFGEELQSLWSLPNVGDIRQVGLVAGIELVRDWRTRKPFELRERAGIRVCDAMARRGVLTRPVGNVIVLMPPYCTTPAQVKRIVNATRESIAGTFKQ